MVTPKIDIPAIAQEDPKNKRKKKLIMRNAPKPPTSVESDYFSFLNEMLKFMSDEFERIVLNGIDIKAFKEIIHDADFGEQHLARLIAKWEAQLVKRYPAKRILKAARVYITKTDRTHKTKFKINVERSFGIDISNIPEFKEYKNFINMAVARNVTLIKSLKGQSMTSLETMLRTAIEKGTSVENMAKSIRENYTVSRKRAVLIARNEIKNVTGMLNQKRMRNVGFEMYEWSNSQDRAVRGNPNGLYPIKKKDPASKTDHWIMEGLICRFDDPTVYSEDGKKWYKRKGHMPKSHPGTEIQCRCEALPYVDLDE